MIGFTAPQAFVLSKGGLCFFERISVHAKAVGIKPFIPSLRDGLAIRIVPGTSCQATFLQSLRDKYLTIFSRDFCSV
jgi:hypothetical protein